MRSRRSNRLGEFLAFVAASGSGGAAAFSPASPTGRPSVDAVLSGLAVGTATYAAAWAPRWVLVLTAGSALIAGVAPLLIVIAAASMMLSLWICARRCNAPVLRAVAAGASLNVLCWAELHGFFGLSAMVALGTGLFLLAAGLHSRPRRLRRRVWTMAGVSLGLVVAALVAFGLTAADVRSKVQDAHRHVASGMELLRDGEYDDAAAEFEAASTALTNVERGLDDPLGIGAGFVPVVSQHRTAALRLAEAGSAATERLGAALRQVDLESIGPVGGTISLAAIAALDSPLDDVDTALRQLDDAVSDVQSPWLIDPFRDRLDEIHVEIAENAPSLQLIRDTVALAPRMLGDDAERVYLVLFTTPAEARGVGGFPGNYAELTARQGHIEMTGFGRASELEELARATRATVPGPQGFLDRYAQFIFNRDGLLGAAPIRNLTMTPHFPWVGEVAAQLYEQITGVSLDGVMVVDPFVIQELLAFTGPIELNELSSTLTADNAAQFLLIDQYVESSDDVERLEALDEAGNRAFEAFLETDIPDPNAVVDAFGPLVDERRLLLWSPHADEQNLLRELGLLGEVPDPAGSNGWSVTVNNAAASKLDSFLQRTVSYQVTTDPATAESVSILHVELTNTAPAQGLPDYIIGNLVGLPRGTSRLWVSFYSATPLQDASLDHEAVALAPGIERGWNVYSTYVDIPPGQTVLFELTFAGHVAEPSRIVTWTQPLTLEQTTG